MSSRPVSLWRQRDFRLLWGGSLVSEIGSSVTTIALPLAAVEVLRASTFQVAMLSAATSAAFLLVALPAGVLVDRAAKRPLMLASDLLRAVLLAAVPITAALGVLSLPILYADAVLTGVLTVVFDVAYQSFLPTLVGRDRLVEANSKFGLPSSLSNVIGPSLGGSLVAAVGAAQAVVVDAASYVVSVCTLAMMRTREPTKRTTPTRTTSSVRQDIAAGLSFVARHTLLRRVVACTASSNLFNSMRTAITVVFLVRVLHAAPGTIGLVYMLGSAGGVAGGFLAGPSARVLGSARALWLGKLALGWMVLAIPLARPGHGVFLVSFGAFVSSFSVVVFNVSSVSYRQAVCPPELLGRMNASIRWIIWGTMPLGAVLGGTLATAFGIRATLTVAVLGSWLSVLWIVASPLRGMRTIPVHSAYSPVADSQADSTA
ncbi:MFS family permease [Catenulispora sp. GP43]|uniref:MFS transporter n=1 Tax=Catenulispora sp. GP43 TaxID=3156263 RepID=UPI0035162864